MKWAKKKGKPSIADALQSLTDAGIGIVSASAQTNYSAGSIPEIDLHLTLSPLPKQAGEIVQELHAWVASNSPWGKA